MKYKKAEKSMFVNVRVMNTIQKVCNFNKIFMILTSIKILDIEKFGDS